MKHLAVLSIGTDATALDAGSRTHARLVDYAARCKKFVAIVACSRTETVGDESLEIVGSGGGRLSRFWNAWRVARMYKNYDVVTAQDPFENGIVAYFLARHTGARLHIQCHTDPFAEGFVGGNILDRVRSYIARFVLARADAVRCVSKRAQHSIERVTGAVADVVPIVVPSSVATAPTSAPFKKTIILVSRLESEKGITIVIDALPEVFANYPDAGILIVGDGRLRSSLEQQVHDLGLTDRVVFAGAVADVQARLASATVFVQASAYEGYGLSLLEAAQARLPIVTTDVGLVGEVLRNGESCVVVERSAPAIASAVARIFSDTTFAQNIAEQAQRAAQATLRTPEQYADAIVDGFERAQMSHAAQPLLVYCQAMDRNDNALGFFVDWIAELAQHHPHITVACLKRGDDSGLPHNVTVCSLGKDEGKGRMTYIARALSIAWKQRAHYDSVFVHMNEEYPLLCGWLWRLMGKRVSMWRNHHSGTWRTRVAGWMCDRVLCTSRFSYTASFPNNRLMPVGVNLSRFSIDAAVARSPKKVLFLARLDCSKGVEVVIHAFAHVVKKVPDAMLEIVGSPTDPQSPYPAELAALVQELKLSEHVSFVGSIANAQTPQVYRGAAVFVNASSSGMYDKTIFEAMACGCVVVASNDNLRGIYDDRYIPEGGNVEQFATAITTALTLEEADRAAVVNRGSAVAQNNSLKQLGDSLSALL